MEWPVLPLSAFKYVDDERGVVTGDIAMVDGMALRLVVLVGTGLPVGRETLCISLS